MGTYTYLVRRQRSGSQKRHRCTQLADSGVQRNLLLFERRSLVLFLLVARAQERRLPQNVHLGRTLLVLQIGDLVLELLEQVLQANATLTLHVVMQVALLDGIGLVGRIRIGAIVVHVFVWSLERRTSQFLAHGGGGHRRAVQTDRAIAFRILTTDDRGVRPFARHTFRRVLGGNRGVLDGQCVGRALVVQIVAGRRTTTWRNGFDAAAAARCAAGHDRFRGGGGGCDDAGGDLVGDGRLKGSTILGGWIGGKGFVADGDNVDFFFCKSKKKNTRLVHRKKYHKSIGSVQRLQAIAFIYIYIEVRLTELS